GVAHVLADEKKVARDRFEAALKVDASYAAARTAIGQLDASGSVTMQFTPEIPRPWGDAKAIVATLDRFQTVQQQMAAARATYQKAFLQILAAFGKGPLAPTKQPAVRNCPIDRVAPLWQKAKDSLELYTRLGGELEVVYRFVARHDALGTTAALLPNSRAQVAAAKAAFKT